MGIFGSRKKTTVGTSVMRVIEDDKVPNSIQTGAMRSILNNDGQLVENTMEELAGSLATRIRRMYRYGQTKYIYGRPSGTTMTNLMGKNTIDAAITAEVGGDVEIDYYHFGPANLTHLGWLVLVRDYGYNSMTNTLVVDSKTVYLSDMQPVIVEATLSEMEDGSLDVWGKGANTGVTPDRVLVTAALQAAQPSPFVVDPAATADYVRVKYCWQEDEVVVVEGFNVTRKSLKRGELNLTLAGFDFAADYHQARYLRNGQAGYWVYQAGSNLKPEIEAIFATTPEAGGTFFPVAYFRFDKQNTATNPNSEQYKSTHKLLKTINMDFADMAEAINENPDIADVEQAMMVLAVPAKSDEPIEQRYLFEFFDNLYQGSKVRNAVSSSLKDFEIRENLGLPSARTSIVIQDKKFKMALAWQSISKRRIAGSIGVVGTHSAITNINTDTQQGVTVAGITIQLQTNVPTHIYRHQITEGLFEEIQVLNLKMTYYIWGDYTATGDENDDILLIPLDYAIVENYSMSERERLAARSMHLVFNSRVVTKLKWYQTGIFKVVIIVVAVILAWNSYGTSLKLAAALLAVGAYVAAATILFTIAFEYLVMALVIKLFVKVVGAKIAFIVAIVAAIYGTYTAVQAGSISGAPFAQQMLGVATSLTNKSMEVYLKGEYSDLMTQADLLRSEQEAKMEKLEKATNLLDGPNTHLSPMIIFGETPDDFYQRTVHSGNIGVLGIEAISSYVDMKLTLPKLSETLGEFV